MVFTSPVFLGIFLPLLFALYFFANEKARSCVLLLFSLCFYAWGEPRAVFVMIALMVVNYVLALLIERTGCRGKDGDGRVAVPSATASPTDGDGAPSLPNAARLALTIFAVVVDLGALVGYKYLGFFCRNLQPLSRLVGLDLPIPEIALPIGISFYVFQIISYVVDVHRRAVPAQRNPFRFMLYVSLFPQLIAGPIVRYTTIAVDLANRRADFENIVAGLRRFTIGLAKKVLIADVMASIADVVFAAPVDTIPCFYAWLGAIAYTLQIYFDFSGYSDMAIGLGRVFNFRFLENFDHPYASTSVQEFWRRWHISLSSWFRDYLYIPLGGNRRGAARTYLNSFIVFFLCGLWHGAAWTFVVWGVYHGIGLVVERVGFGKIVAKWPKAVGNLYLMLFVVVGWVFFRSPDLGYSVGYLGNMFGGAAAAFTSFVPAHDFIAIDRFALMIVGVVASYPIFDRFVVKVPEAVRLVSAMVLFLVVYVLGMTSGYSPFIYFRF